MRKIGRSRVAEPTAAKQWPVPLGRMAEESLWDAVALSGVEFALEQLEAERAGLCGRRHAHLEERAAMRAGRAKSSLSLGGRRAELERPRVRGADGHELALPSWAAWSARDPLERRAVEPMILGVGDAAKELIRLPLY